MSPLSPGSTFGQYEILGPLGDGGMADVYRVRHRGLGRIEALKVMRDGSADPHAAERFLNDARIAAGLRHPNIVTVFAVGEHGGRPFIAMEHIAGESLEKTLARERRLTLDAAHPLLTQVADALDAAHEGHVVHRDVKPANILLQAGGGNVQAKVVDFGIARSEDIGQGLTRAGMIIGTPEYMAPEQVDSPGHVGPCADQYALAVVAYEALCGRPPFLCSELGQFGVLNAHVKDPVPRPSLYVRNLPAHAEKALLRALSKRSEDRFEDCRAFVAAMSPTGKGRGRRPNVAVVAVGAVALAGALLVLASLSHGTSEPPKDVFTPPSVDAKPVLHETEPTLDSKPDTLPTPAPPKVPDVTGLTGREAEDRLRQDGYAAETSLVFDSAPSGRVLRQTPTAGSELERGGRVRLIVSRGEEPRPAPPALPPSMTRPLGLADLAGKSKQELDYVRNEIYARHGYRFKRADLRTHFSQFDWYKPDTGDMAIVERRLSALEKANAGRILRYQQGGG